MGICTFPLQISCCFHTKEAKIVQVYRFGGSSRVPDKLPQSAAVNSDCFKFHNLDVSSYL